MDFKALAKALPKRHDHIHFESRMDKAIADMWKEPFLVVCYLRALIDSVKFHGRLLSMVICVLFCVLLYVRLHEVLTPY